MTDPIKYEGWPEGMNNIAPDYALPEGTLRTIVNADVLDAGDLRLRKGFSELYSASNIHGACSLGSDGIAIAQGTSLVLRRSDGTTTNLRTGLTSAPMTFLPLNGEVFFSNGTNTGKIVSAAAKDWGVETCTVPPAVATTTGGLPAGTYQAICTFASSSGEEGGCGRSVAVVLASAGGLTITPPTPASAEVASTNFYLTPPDGDVFYHVGSTTGGAALRVQSEPAYGPALKTQFMVQMLPGTQIIHYRGRLYVVDGPVLWHSEAFAFGLCHPSKNFILFPEDITLAADANDGIYVASDQLYFLAGTGPGDFQQSVALPARAAKGVPARLPDTNDVLIYTDRGLAVGKDGGVVEVFDKNIRVDPASDVALLVREQDSLRQYVGVARNSPYSSGFVAQDFMDAEIIRKEQ